METHNLPTNLSRLPAIVLSGDPDGILERRAFDLCLVDIVGAARLALTIQNPMRRGVFVRGFRPATIRAAQNEAGTTGTEGKQPG